MNNNPINKIPFNPLANVFMNQAPVSYNKSANPQLFQGYQNKGANNTGVSVYPQFVMP